uniref:hypothetical protein n=1 Tax=Dietzia lutea TaxID=546160 RepID=UPI001F1D1032
TENIESPLLNSIPTVPKPVTVDNRFSPRPSSFADVGGTQPQGSQLPRDKGLGLVAASQATPAITGERPGFQAG